MEEEGAEGVWDCHSVVDQNIKLNCYFDFKPSEMKVPFKSWFMFLIKQDSILVNESFDAVDFYYFLRRRVKYKLINYFIL